MPFFTLDGLLKVGGRLKNTSQNHQKEPQSLDIVLEKTDDLKLEVIVIGLNFKHKRSH